MGYEQIRELIARAVAHEATTHTVRNVLDTQTRAQGLNPTAKDLDAAVAFVRGYIEAIPELLEQAAVAASAAGIGPVVAPLLQAAIQYFVEPNDLIPDSNGLAGLADDAYLALGLISAISQRHFNQFGRQIFDANFGPAHAQMRYLLGPAIADQLDVAVLNAATTMYPQLAPGLAQAPKPMELPRDPYAGLSLDTRVELAKAGTLII